MIETRRILIKKKLCSVLLALCMVLTLLPVSALAHDGTEVNVGSADELQTALTNATDGQTIKLTTNIELSKKLTFYSQNITVTLDLDSHSITGTGNDYAIDCSNSGSSGTGKLIVKNGTVQRTESATGSNSTIRNYQLLELDNLTVSGNYIVVKNEETANLVMANCVLTAPALYNGNKVTSGLQNWGTAEVTGCTITAGNALLAASYADASQSYNSNTTLTNCTLNGTYNSISSGRADKSTAMQIITVIGGNYTGNVNSGAGSNITIGAAVTGDLSVVNDFSYALGSAEYLTSGPSTTTISEGGSISGNISAAAKVGNTYYSTLAAAVSADSSDTVTLISDTTEDVTIPADKTITLDLNGHKLTNVSGHTITNNGNLTIVGSGTVDNKTNSKAALYNNTGATATLNGGTFTRSAEAGTASPDSANGNSWYTVKNYGTMTINSNTTITNTGSHSSAIVNGWYDASKAGTNGEPTRTADAVLTINGGNISGGKITVKNDDYGTLTITGGTFTQPTNGLYCIYNANVTAISGGTVNGAVGSYNGSIEGDLGKLDISGGTYTIDPTEYVVDGSIARKDSDTSYTVIAKSNLTSGTYMADPAGFLAAGYVSYANGDGTYTVYYPVPVTPGNTSSTTTTNPDGSTTTTTTDKATGTVTEVTKNTDGSTTTVETKKDGSVTETNKTANGSVGTVKSDANGNTEISASISAADVSAAEKKDEPVTAPVTVAPAASSAAAPVIKVSVPASAGEVSVAIPVTNAQQGTVAVRVNADGTEEIIKTSIVTENGVVLGVKGTEQIKIINNDTDFIDTVGHWAESDVDFVSARELFNGTGPATFSPEASMTRGMVATVLARLAGENTDGGANWYDKGCAWAVANGVSDGTDPNGSITREQLAAMLYRYAGSPAVSGSLGTYADASSVSDYAASAMQWCVNSGIITGMDGLLNPQGQATRAQVSAMFARYIRLMAAK